MNSLHQLAQDNKLGNFQSLDSSTILWIKKYLDFTLTDNYSIKQHALLEISTCRESWFLEKNTINGIHGIRHMFRVACNIIDLYNYYQLPEILLRPLIAAAMLHDIRRCNDRKDLNHGQRAADWFLDNQDTVGNLFVLDDNQIDIVYSLIALHEIPYNELNYKIYKKYFTGIDIIKAADAMDRYRLPKIEWWISYKYIRLTIPRFLLRRSATRTIISELKYLETQSNVLSIKSIYG